MRIADLKVGKLYRFKRANCWFHKNLEYKTVRWECRHGNVVMFLGWKDAHLHDGGYALLLNSDGGRIYFTRYSQVEKSFDNYFELVATT